MKSPLFLNTMWGIDENDAAILQISSSNIGPVLIRRMVIAGSIAGGVVMLEVAVRQQWPSLFLLLVVVSAAPLTWWLFVQKISTEAQRRRTDMNMAVAVFLDLVNVLLAGGAGIETAIVTAASAGDGWAFNEIRSAIARAQSSRENYWNTLHVLGNSLRVQSLQDVAQSIRLAGEHGGRIRQSLTSRADALRKKNLADIEHEAEKRTERMGVPMVVMFVGFVIFIGYPAFVTTVTAL